MLTRSAWLLYLLPLVAVAAPRAFTPTYEPVLTISPAPGPIRIDGELDDPGWISAARADGFAEHSPGDATEPPVHSEAWVTYDPEHLYVALIAHDDPSTVRARWCDRDAIFQDDYFGIMFATYSDLAWGYEFFVNPLGIQGDLRVNGDGSEEISFDLIWDSKGRVTDRGYQVELAIPFASLRFPNREVQTWRFNVWRDHQREHRRRYTWSAIDRDIAGWMCQWGTLTGIRGIRGRHDVDIVTSMVGQQVGERTDDGFEMDDPEGRLGMNARYGLSSSASVELALNPDFSQIESDAGQIDVNSTFAIFYSEQRPFFQEGSDLYNTYISAVHTRSINDPRAAAKFTGTYGRYTLLYLLARDQNSPILLPGEESSYQPLIDNGISGLKSVTQLIRLRRTLLEDSHIGFTATDRRFDSDPGGAGSVLGLDGSIRLHPNLRVEFQGLASHTKESEDTLLTQGMNDIVFDQDGHTLAFDGESFWGEAIYASLERDGRLWHADVDYFEFSPTFRTDNGFTTRNHSRHVTLENSLEFRPNRAFLVDWTPALDIGRIWNHDGVFKEDWVQPSLWFRLIGQTTTWWGLRASREAYGGRRFYNLLSGTVDFDSRPSSVFGVNGELSLSRTIYRNSDHPRLANAFYGSTWLTLKPTARMVLQPSYRYYRLNERHGGETIYDGYIARCRVDYQFSREFSARLVAEYDDFDQRMDLEPLLTYRINSFTVFYLGATRRQIVDDEEPDRWQPTDRQYFAKIQYLWQP